MGSLLDDLGSLLNSYNKENDSNTPDYVLAQYMLDCLRAFNQAVMAREGWHGRAVGDGENAKGMAVKAEPLDHGPESAEAP